MTDQQAAASAVLNARHRDLERVMRTGGYSLGLLAELAQHAFNGVMNVPAVIDEIRHLENGGAHSRSKGARQFQREPLKGLWYKHYFQSRFLPQDLINELPHVDLAAALRREAGLDKSEDIILDDRMVGILVHEVVLGSLERRSAERRLTGEWIVFEEVGGANRYLTLAEHREGDQRIFERIENYRREDAKLAGMRITGFNLLPPEPEADAEGLAPSPGAGA